MARPRLITEHTLAADALRRFCDHYNGHIQQKTWRFADGRDPADIKHYLQHGPLTVERVEKVLSGWCEVTCDGCCERVRWAVEVGDEPDCESRTAVLCRTCLREAASLDT